MLQLAAVPGGEPVSLDVLATAQNLPRRFLEAIFSDLKGGGLVRSVRGPRGGYVLTRKPEDIPLGDVFRAVSGPLAEVRGLRPHETHYIGVASHLPTVWVAVRAALRDVLDTTTLASVLDGKLPPHVKAMAEQPDAWQNR
jgi:Rrf2 family protein